MSERDRERERERIFLIAARILVRAILGLKFIVSVLLRMLKMNRLIIFPDYQYHNKQEDCWGLGLGKEKTNSSV